MKPFIYSPLPARVVFGFGTSRNAIVKELEYLGATKVIIVTDAFGKAAAEGIEKEIPVALRGGIFAEAAMHTPHDVTLKALDYANNMKADCTVAIGGGSCTGLSKALALYSSGRIKQIVIPTTYAGSEATSILGETKDGLKVTQKQPVILPQTIIYDVELTMSLPSRLAATSGINAIAHAVEAVYSSEHNPVVELMALNAIEVLARALPAIDRDPNDKEARSDALYGAWLCGTCLGASSMSLHHKMCHTLGGSFNMPHADTHTVLLPHAMAYNAPFVPEAARKIAKALGSQDAAQGLFDLAKSLNAPTSLKELGFEEANIKKAAEIASKTPYPNPAPLLQDKLEKMLNDAYSGTRPAPAPVSQL